MKNPSSDTTREIQNSLDFTWKHLGPDILKRNMELSVLANENRSFLLQHDIPLMNFGYRFYSIYYIASICIHYTVMTNILK